MNYLLYTNAVVALLRSKPTKARERYRKAEAFGDYLALSSVVLFELWYGVAKSSHVPQSMFVLRFAEIYFSSMGRQWVARRIILCYK